MVSQSKDQWIEERREKFRCPHCGDVIACSEEGVLGLYSAKILEGISRRVSEKR